MTDEIAVDQISDLTIDDFRTPSMLYDPQLWPQNQMEADQLKRELADWIEGHDRELARHRKAMADNDPLRTTTANRLIRHSLEDLAAYIRAAASKVEENGRRPRWYEMVYAIVAEPKATTLASVTLKAIVSHLIAHLGDPEKSTYTNFSAHVGAAMENAVNAAIWKANNPKQYRAYVRRMTERPTTPRHRRDNMRRGAKRWVRDEEEIEPWGQRLRVGVGKAFLDCALKVTGIGQVERLPNKRVDRRRSIVVLDDKVVDWFLRQVNEDAIRSSVPRAMICEPVPWTGPKGGGVLLPHHVPQVRLPRLNLDGSVGPHVTKGITTALRDAPPLMVYEAVNLLQSTQFAINEAVYQTAAEATRTNLHLDDLPESFREPIPRRPQAPTKEHEESEGFKEELRAWRIKSGDATARNVTRASKTLWARMTLGESIELLALLKGIQPIHFAHRVDFRGRIYAEAAWLNPQGSDLARHMLKFHRGQEIGDGDGPWWLAAQVAKAFAKDRLSWEDRVQWTHDNEDMIRRIARDPLGNRSEWEGEAGKDNIWPAYAAAYEWIDYVDGGRRPEFVTTLPCYVDGTCNGIQHFGALSQNEALASAVNLAPGPQKQDIYEDVATAALEIITMKVSDGTPTDKENAKLWLLILENKTSLRALTKKIVMTRGYGASYMSDMEAVREFLDEVDKDRTHWRWRDANEWKLVGWITKRIREAMTRRLGAAEEIMKWLEGTMHLLQDHRALDKLDWRPISSWPWRNIYYQTTEKDVANRIDGVRSRSKVAIEDISRIDILQAKRSVSPNFVHGLDAASLVFALDLMTKQGIRDVTAIHDSVGGLAPEMSKIAKCIREGFIACHETRPLETFREAVIRALPSGTDVAPVPPVGDFDVQEVLNSRYFFS